MRPILCVAAAAGFACVLVSCALAAEPGERTVCRWDFSQGDVQGWTALHSVQPLSAVDGALRMVTTGSDPYIASPPFQAATSAGMLIRMVYRTALGGGAEFFWAAAERPEDAQFKGGDEIAADLSPGDTWQTLNAVPGWQPGLALTRIRLDAPEGKGAVIEIRSIEIVERPLPPDLPITPSYVFPREDLALAFTPGPGMARVFGEQGHLVCVTDSNPGLAYSPVFHIESADAGVAGLSVRALDPVRLDVVFRREGASLFAPGDMAGLWLEPTDDFRTVNLDLRPLPGYKGAIDRLALRVFGRPGARVEFQGVSILPGPQGPALLELTRCAPRAYVTGLTGALEVDLVVTNRGGKGSPETAVSATGGPEVSEGGAQAVVPPLAPMACASVPVQVPLSHDFAGGPVSVRVALRDGPARTARALAVPLPGPEAIGADPMGPPRVELTPEGHVVLANGMVAAVFPHTPAGYGPGVFYALNSPDPQRVGSTPALGMVAGTDGQFGPLTSTEQPTPEVSRDSAAVSFRVALRLGDVTRNGVATFRVADDRPEVEARLTVQAGPAATLSGLLFPAFLAGDGSFGEARDLGVLPGLEYLLPGEISSGPDFVDPPKSLRFAPHPFRVTAPMMWVTKGDLTVGMRWDPVQTWAAEGQYPTPVFSSPDRLLGGPGHRMSLLVPGVLGGGRENSLTAEPPSDLAGDRDTAVSAFIFALRGSDVEPAMRYLLGAMSATGTASPPAAPEPSPSSDVIFERAAVGLSRTLWVPDKALWYANLPPSPRDPLYSEQYAQTLWLFGAERQGDDVGREAMSVYRAAVDARRTAAAPVGWEPAAHEGQIRLAVEGLRAHARRVAESIRPDGTWPYTADSAIRRSFGVDGDTSTGLTAVSAQLCLKAALVTQDDECLKTGLAALAFLDTQPRPEGAQTWELSLHVPDVLACAYCVRAYVTAYRLTAEPRYLAGAQRWAWRAMPFIYLWNPPERPVMRYGSIPVFGATHFRSPWFGWIVQWNGLEVADALLDLAAADSSFDWSAVARGITLSGGQQMRPVTRDGFDLADHIPDTGHPGLYPDSYSAVAGTDSYTWDLEPSLIARAAHKLASPYGWSHTEVVRDTDRMVTITTLAQVGDVTLNAGRLSLSLNMPGELGPHAIAISGLRGPTSVVVGGTALQPAAPALGPQPGTYSWDEAARMLYVAIPAAAEPVKVEVADGK